MTQVLPPRDALDGTSEAVERAEPVVSSQGPAGSVTIDFLTPADWQHLRATRLAALEDSPEAFATTFHAEQQRTPDEWIGILERSSWVVARQGGVIVGIACLAEEDWEGPKKRFIESVWVEENQRRQGLVRRMLQRLEDQARLDGAEYLQLWVLDTNGSAADAYLKLKFDWVPDRVQRADKLAGTPVMEHLMIKSIFQ